MDIEATIEDLEAQAYFASLGVTEIREYSKAIFEVNYIFPESPTSYLSWPIVGKDFVAGFDAKGQDCKSAWLLIPTRALQSMTSTVGEIEMGELDAISLLKSKVLGERVNVRFVNRSPAISGVLVRVQDNFLSIKLSSPSLIHVNLSSVRYLAVEKLKTQVQHSA